MLIDTKSFFSSSTQDLRSHDSLYNTEY